MTTEQIIEKLNRTIDCLGSHPDYKPGSEFEDRIADLVEIVGYLANEQNHER